MTESSQTESREMRIGQLLNELLDCRARGEPLSLDRRLAEHPDLADEVREHLGILGRLPGSRLAAEAVPVPAIAGYEIVSEIGRGGMGAVFKAYQQGTRRLVALKVMLDGPLAKPSAHRRFQREIELAAQLRHPNIVTLHDSGTAGGRCYFAMDYVAGLPLDAWVHTHGCTVRRLIELFVKICGAVSYAHQRGIIHRDLKPSNILVDDAGEPWVLDFGLARPLAEDAEAITGHSMQDRLVGTLRYMSPEQTRGAAGTLDVRSDVYSLGVTLYEMLTGRCPYDTDLQGLELRAALHNIQEVDPVRPSRYRRECGSEIDAIVLWALQKNPERRYQSAAALEADLGFWLEGRPILARSSSSLYVLGKLAARHYFHTSVIVALLASMVGFGWITREALLRERSAATRLESTYQSVTRQNADLARVAAEALERQNQAALGWVLLEWRSGRANAARSIHAQMTPGSPEHAAAAFLMEDTLTVSQLESQLPAGAEGLARFIEGERHLNHGRLEEAERAFRAYPPSTRGLWASLVQERLAQIRGLGAERSQRLPMPEVPDELAIQETGRR